MKKIIWIAGLFMGLVFLAGSTVAVNFEPGIDPVKMLQSEDPEVRSDGCLALISEGPFAVDVLAPLLGDQSMLVRHCAAYALSRIGGADVEQLFQNKLDSRDYDIRRISALGLGMMGKKGVVEAVGPLLEDENWEVRWAAAYALGKSRDRRALGRLGPVAESDSYYDSALAGYPVRQAAEKSIRILEGVIGWYTNLPPARATAREEGKPLLLYFRRSGSLICRQFERVVFQQEKIIDALQRCVCVWVDYLISPEIFERYQVGRVPELLFLSPAGECLGRQKGVILPETLLIKLLKILEGERRSIRLRNHLRENPEDWEAAWQLAELRLEEGRWAGALEALSVIIQNDPYNTSALLDNALFARAFIRGKRGDYENSRRDFQTLCGRFSHFGDRAEALYCWGLSAWRAGRREEAESVLRQLVKEYPETFLAQAAEKILSVVSGR